MAGHDLIAAFLDDLDRKLGGRVRPTERIRAELEDHLRCCAEALVAAGARDADAQRLAIERLGDADHLSAMFVELDRTSGPAVPTAFTTTAGVLGLVGGAGLGLAIGVTTAAEGGATRNAAAATAGAALTAIAVTLMLAGLAAIVVRHRGALGRRGWGGLAGMVAGVVLTFALAPLLGWATGVVTLPLVLGGVAMFLFAVYRAHAMPRPPLLAMLAAGTYLLCLAPTGVRKQSALYTVGWVLLLGGWCWLQFTLWSERPSHPGQPPFAGRNARTSRVNRSGASTLLT